MIVSRSRFLNVYKALLFLGAGSVIHAVADNQDFRKYGGLINYLPLTYSVMLIASLSLVAFPVNYSENNV